MKEANSERTQNITEESHSHVAAGSRSRLEFWDHDAEFEESPIYPLSIYGRWFKPAAAGIQQAVETEQLD